MITYLSFLVVNLVLTYLRHLTFYWNIKRTPLIFYLLPNLCSLCNTTLLSELLQLLGVVAPWWNLIARCLNSAQENQSLLTYLLGEVSFQCAAGR